MVCLLQAKERAAACRTPAADVLYILQYFEEEEATAVIPEPQCKHSFSKQPALKSSYDSLAIHMHLPLQSSVRDGYYRRLGALTGMKSFNRV